MATNNRMALLEELRKYLTDKDKDFLREAATLVVNSLMDSEVSSITGAEKYERNENRSTYRNGYRDRDWNTRLGTLELKIPKLRQGSYFPSLLEPRKRLKKALLNVVQEAYVHGVSTRKVDDLVEALGMKGIDKSEVSRISKQLDDFVEEFKNRKLESEYPYLWLDATFPKAREGGRVCSMALVIAVGVNKSGEREILGFDVGMSEDGEFWKEFLRGLVSRGLKGVKLVISDSHEGLKMAIKEILTGTTWQRCRVHFMRNVLSQVPKKYQGMVSSIVRTIFAQNDQKSAKLQLRHVVDELKNRFPKAMAILEDAEDDVLAYMVFPHEHWSKICSTNPLERLNREIRRRTDVVCMFPNREAVIRLVGAMLMEQNDEYQVGRRYLSLESMAKITDTGEYTLAPVALLHK